MANGKIIALDQLQMLAEKVEARYGDLVSGAEYTIVKQETAEDSYAATYYLTKNDTQVGEKINIPKDLMVKNAEVLTVTTANDPYTGAAVGDKYIDFTINTADDSATGKHIYLAVKDLGASTYTGGDGINISDSNAISAKIDTSNANGLGVSASGLQLSLATDSAAGALSATDKAKLDSFELATDTEVDAMLSGVFDADFS